MAAGRAPLLQPGFHAGTGATLEIEEGPGASLLRGGTASLGKGAARSLQAPGVVALAVAYAASWVLHLGCVLGGLRAVGNTYAVGFDNRLDARAVFGTVLFFWGLGTAALVTGLTTVHLARTKALSDAVKATALAAYVVGGVVTVVTCFTADDMLQIAITFRTSPMPDNFRQFLAGFVFLMYTGLTIAIAAVLLPIVRRLWWGTAGLGERGRGAGRDTMAPAQPTDWRLNLRGIATLIAVFALVWWLTSFMTPVWNYSATSYFANSYAATIAGGGTWYSLVNTTWTVWDNAAADIARSPANTWNPPIIYFKLYEDVCVYMTIVLFLALGGAIGSALPRVRRLLHRRMKCPHYGIPTYFSLWPVGITVGETIVTTAFYTLFAYWIYYWGFKYQRLRNEGPLMFDPYASMQTAARVLGHMTTLTMSFLTYPMARNSVWEAVWGIPFERGVRYHRALGRLTWGLVTLHMALWQIKWAREGTLWNNIVTLDNLLIANTASNPAAVDPLHDDNFTVVVVQLAWLILTAALIVATFFRRSHYRLFQYTHHAVWFFFFAALLHSWSHWYYLAAGLTFYALDKLGRLINGAADAEVVAISHAEGITRLDVAAAVLSKSGSGHFLLSGGGGGSLAGYYAGQYAFLCLPHLGALDWHPFTIASPPPLAMGVGGPRDGGNGRTLVSFFIKDMGPGTWTHRLAQLATTEPAITPSSIPLSVDGPYGRAGHYYERDTVVLVAGGISITPMLSIFLDLHARAAATGTGAVGGGVARGTSVRRVVLIWVCREAGLFAQFAEMLAPVMAHDMDGRFIMHLHHTGKGDGAGAGAGAGKARTGRVFDAEHGSDAAHAARCIADLTARVKQGRPRMDDLIGEVAATAKRDRPDAHPSDAVSLMVCGPEPMIESASELAFRHGFDFHSEVFHF